MKKKTNPNCLWDIYLISCHPRTQHRPNHPWINIIRQDSQIIRIQSDILLETAILMMEMVRTSNAVLLDASEAKLAPTTDPAREADSYQAADAEILAVTPRSQRDDPPDAFVSAHVREFDLRYGIAVCAGGGAVFGVEVCRSHHNQSRHQE
ncbi:hypothetical protein VTN77DRAFT_6411 [Rasamsonia byssochlamydoides]|uniref:uncharacterized protein n=1 Tax=Rasamsonia byssochlamydoides TaxID=89139 RepID=UPI003742AA40